MGGHRLLPPTAICLVQGEQKARAKINHLDQTTDAGHFGLQVRQPWHEGQKYVYDEDRSN